VGSADGDVPVPTPLLGNFISVTVKCGVFFAVRTEFLDVIQTGCGPLGTASLC
jgi:hypothetical protein